jgi:hypothetical protein
MSDDTLHGVLKATLASPLRRMTERKAALHSATFKHPETGEEYACVKASTLADLENTARAAENLEPLVVTKERKRFSNLSGPEIYCYYTLRLGLKDGRKFNVKFKGWLHRTSDNLFEKVRKLEGIAIDDIETINLYTSIEPRFRKPQTKNNSQGERVYTPIEDSMKIEETR